MKKYHSSVFLRVLICTGIIFFAVNSVFFYLGNPNDTIRLLLLIGLIVQFIIGALILFLKTEKLAYHFFLALIFVGWSILNGVVAFGFPNQIGQAWPLYLVLTSIFLFLTGIRKYKKVKYGYLIPSFVLLCMGVWFSLFSFRIVKISFKTVSIIVGPIFILVIGLLLISVFLLQQRHDKFIVNDDDYGDFDDEELSFPKID